MILPNKHLNLSQSLFGVGAMLLRHLDAERTVTSLWASTHSMPEIVTFERFTLGLDFLFMIEAIEFRNGLLGRVSK
jgi:hypothetical protein